VLWKESGKRRIMTCGRSLWDVPPCGTFVYGVRYNYLVIEFLDYLGL
jgi:hypothetical protein